MLKREDLKNFAEELKKLIEKLQDHLCLQKKLAELLSVSDGMVDTARRRNRLQVRVSTLGHSGLAQRRLIIKNAITANPGKRNTEILEELRKAGNSGLTLSIVEHVRHDLIGEGRVQRKKSAVRLKTEGTILPSKVEEAKITLRMLLEQLVDTGESVNLAQLIRENPSLRVSHGALLRAYHIIAQERIDQGLPVPPLKKKWVRRTLSLEA